MGHDWQELSKLVGSNRIEVDRVKLVDTGVAIEGPFTLPPLAQLSAEDQVFVAAFVRCHGSIKQMEKFFGVSYPTIKNRLNRISDQLPGVEVEPDVEAVPASAPATPSPSDLITRLERGELSVDDVVARLQPTKTETSR